MKNSDFDQIIARALKIRTKYHELEHLNHGSEWSIEEDALAYLSDAGLVGRNVMAQQERWPKAYAHEELEHKLAENIWWLIVLANRMDMDIKMAMEKFLSKTEDLVGA
ncbi:nucleoside triphosphate pyrophosphohydrolase family protein [Pedobacter rhizosphaerae]|uniref:MazG-like protein n=1 Tax=Pedobacter rhizosphaerae TaxID=390241 RepID=A0A1H9WB17_9SPHI|nr:MazG-like protein [Pedobacter rhizosphaerae]SES31025.1 hypothetical protein SAMN04488023_1674 [Pedobacter rhizosphaerae]